MQLELKKFQLKAHYHLMEGPKKEREREREAVNKTQNERKQTGKIIQSSVAKESLANREQTEYDGNKIRFTFC